MSGEGGREKKKPRKRKRTLTTVGTKKAGQSVNC